MFLNFVKYRPLFIDNILWHADDVYTTIPDPNNPVYTSGSETYARIPPLNVTVEAEINPVPVSTQANEDIGAPQPPV